MKELDWIGSALTWLILLAAAGYMTRRVVINIKNRMWLLGIAQHELYASMMRTDPVAVKSVMSQFEHDMRSQKMWPFDSPETMKLSFSAWLGRQDHRYWSLWPSERSTATNDQLESRPLAEPVPIDIIKGVKLHMEAQQLALKAIERGELEVGILEVEARMGTSTFAKASPATKRDFLKLREQLKSLLARKVPGLSQDRGPPRDVVEALIERRENYSGHPAERTDHNYWRISPEFQVLLMVSRIAALRDSGARSQEKMTIDFKARSIFGSADIPSEHVAYTIAFARDIYWIKN